MTTHDVWMALAGFASAHGLRLVVAGLRLLVAWLKARASTTAAPEDDALAAALEREIEKLTTAKER